VCGTWIRLRNSRLVNGMVFVNYRQTMAGCGPTLGRRPKRRIRFVLDRSQLDSSGRTSRQSEELLNYNHRCHL